MTPHDFELGMDNAPEAFVDVALLLTACSFTLLVGVILGYYVEVFFKKQTILGSLTNAPSIIKSDEQQDHWNDAYEAADNGTSNVLHDSLKTEYMQRSKVGVEADSRELNCKPSKV